MKLLLRAALESKVVGIHLSGVHLLRELALKRDVILCGTLAPDKAEVPRHLGGRAFYRQRAASGLGLDRTLVSVLLNHIARNLGDIQDGRSVGGILHKIAEKRLGAIPELDAVKRGHAGVEYVLAALGVDLARE